jgi:hypothetical protein
MSLTGSAVAGAGTSSVTDDVVGYTIAQFSPRKVMHLQQILNGFPLSSGTATTR